MKINLLCIGAGIVGGYFLAIMRLKNVYAQMLEDEVAETTKRLEDDYVKKIEDETGVITKAHEEEIEEVKILASDGAAALINYQGYAKDAVEEAFPREELDETPAAYLIDFEMYRDSTDPWKQAYAEYYELDHVFAGTDGDKVTDKWVDILNGAMYKALEEGAAEETLYFRIEEHQVDIEVFRVNSAYATEVLGESR